MISSEIGPSAVEQGAPRSDWRRAVASLSGAWIVLLLLTWLLSHLILHADGGVVATKIDQPFEAWMRTAGLGLRPLAERVTVLGTWPAEVIGGGAATLVALRRGSARGVVILVACLGADALTVVAKQLVHRVGPTQRAVSGISDYAFPSGHATAAAALAVGAACVLTGDCRWLIRFLALSAAFAVSTAVAASRLVLDVHWLSDVVAGIGVGAVWAVWAVRVVASWPVSPPTGRD